MDTDFDLQAPNLKVPPHSKDAEQSVLGGLLLDNQAFDQVSEILQTRDFYYPDNRLIFNAMARDRKSVV